MNDRRFGALFIAGAVFAIVFWGAVIFVAWHFLAKVW